MRASSVKTAGLGGLVLSALLAGPVPAAGEERVRIAVQADAGAPAGPVAAALSGVLDGRRDGAVAAFYEARGWRPVWLAPDGDAAPEGRALVAALERARAHALPPSAFGAGPLAARLAEAAGRGARAAAALERDLTRAYLDYGRALSSGLLAPRDIDAKIDRDPPRRGDAELLDLLSADRPVRAVLRSLAPDHPDYAALRDRLARYRALVAAGGWGAPVPAGPTLREGDRGARVAALRARLSALGDLRGGDGEAATGAPAGGVVLAANDVVRDAPADPAAADPAVFDAALAAAVRRFQARHGLNEDGLAGPATLEALNRSAARRVRQIAANIERLRWLNRPLGARHVMVNIPGFRMALVQEGRAVFDSRVIVGKPRHATAEFSDRLEFMVINPYWNVPRSIVREELLPALRKDPAHLIKKNMEIVGIDTPSDSIGWDYVEPRDFPGRVRQRPGPGNALGRVKFMFPNEHAIYLHDTPQRHLFARDGRAYSHGCVRVMKPQAFAHWLLADQVADPEARFDEWLSREDEVYVHLDSPVPVHITYRTAPVAPDGPDQFRGDIYGRDAAIARALDAAGLALPPA